MKEKIIATGQETDKIVAKKTKSTYIAEKRQLKLDKVTSELETLHKTAKLSTFKTKEEIRHMKFEYEKKQTELKKIHNQVNDIKC